jgi:hypothetical protein
MFLEFLYSFFGTFPLVFAIDGTFNLWQVVEALIGTSKLGI